MMYRTPLFALLGTLCLWACGEPPLPKPKAQLRLEYPKAGTARYDAGSFSFDYNRLAHPKKETDGGLTLDYPMMKGSIYINYKPIAGNLDKLLSDAQKMSYEHTIKADGIRPKEFMDQDHKVYGMFYEVTGDAASQAQFYATDSTAHFVLGSLYFYARPNYDSVYPAAVYLQRDMMALMESLRWKDQAY